MTVVLPLVEKHFLSVGLSPLSSREPPISSCQSTWCLRCHGRATSPLAEKHPPCFLCSSGSLRFLGRKRIERKSAACAFSCRKAPQGEPTTVFTLLKSTSVDTPPMRGLGGGLSLHSLFRKMLRTVERTPVPHNPLHTQSCQMTSVFHLHVKRCTSEGPSPLTLLG
jgi:hypothetical protein